MKRKSSNSEWNQDDAPLTPPLESPTNHCPIQLELSEANTLITETLPRLLLKIDPRQPSHCPTLPDHGSGSQKQSNRESGKDMDFTPEPVKFYKHSNSVTVRALPIRSRAERNQLTPWMLSSRDTEDCVEPKLVIIPGVWELETRGLSGGYASAQPIGWWRWREREGDQFRREGGTKSEGRLGEQGKAGKLSHTLISRHFPALMVMVCRWWESILRGRWDLVYW